MYHYRLFFKSSTKLNEKCKTECKCDDSFKVSRDLLAEASSTFDVVSVPKEVEEGDVMGLLDPYGKTIYYGVVKSIDSTSIQCNQIFYLFDGDWLYRVPETKTIEEAVLDIIQNDFKLSKDPLMAKKFNFDLSCTTSVTGVLPVDDKNTVKNFKDYLYDIYEKYGILLEFEIPFGEGMPSIHILKKEYSRYLVSNNVNAVKNVHITQEVASTNKLLVYSKEKELRASYYSTPSGITTDAADETRLQSIKTKIVFSDDELDTVVANYLQTQIYNHLITFDLTLNNKIYDFYKLELGQEIEFFYSGKTYHSVLTGYELVKHKKKGLSSVTLTCGLVRVNLDRKLTNLFKKLSVGI